MNEWSCNGKVCIIRSFQMICPGDPDEKKLKAPASHLSEAVNDVPDLPRSPLMQFRQPSSIKPSGGVAWATNKHTLICQREAVTSCSEPPVASTMHPLLMFH